MAKNKVNISKIAYDMGISPSTVSRAISGNGRVSEETRQKIAEYLSENHLIPNTREKRYTDISTNIIAVTVPEEENSAYMPYFQHILFSAYDFFSIRGYQVLPIKTSAKDICNLQAAIEMHVIDGVILSRRIDSLQEINILKEYGVPFVVIGGIDDPAVMQVETDNEHASYDLTSALLHMGYNRMALMCSEKKDPINVKRYKGIMGAHVENYMVLNREFVFYDTDDYDIAELAVERILAADMHCILCMDDNICMNVLRILQKNHIKIPDQIKVASLHNNNMLESWCPPITCVNYDVDAMGKAAGRLLYTYLTEQRKMPNIMMGYEIQMKESTN